MIESLSLSSSQVFISNSVWTIRSFLEKKRSEHLNNDGYMLMILLKIVNNISKHISDNWTPSLYILYYKHIISADPFWSSHLSMRKKKKPLLLKIVTNILTFRCTMFSIQLPKYSNYIQKTSLTLTLLNKENFTILKPILAWNEHLTEKLIYAASFNLLTLQQHSHSVQDLISERVMCTLFSFWDK